MNMIPEDYFLSENGFIEMNRVVILRLIKIVGNKSWDVDRLKKIRELIGIGSVLYFWIKGTSFTRMISSPGLKLRLLQNSSPVNSFRLANLLVTESISSVRKFFRVVDAVVKKYIHLLLLPQSMAGEDLDKIVVEKLLKLFNADIISTDEFQSLLTSISFFKQTLYVLFVVLKYKYEGMGANQIPLLNILESKFNIPDHNSNNWSDLKGLDLVHICIGLEEYELLILYLEPTLLCTVSNLRAAISEQLRLPLRSLVLENWRHERIPSECDDVLCVEEPRLKAKEANTKGRWGEEREVCKYGWASVLRDRRGGCGFTPIFRDVVTAVVETTVFVYDTHPITMVRIIPCDCCGVADRGGTDTDTGTDAGTGIGTGTGVEAGENAREGKGEEKKGEEGGVKERQAEAFAVQGAEVVVEKMNAAEGSSSLGIIPLAVSETMLACEFIGYVERALPGPVDWAGLVVDLPCGTLCYSDRVTLAQCNVADGAVLRVRRMGTRKKGMSGSESGGGGGDGRGSEVRGGDEDGNDTVNKKGKDRRMRVGPIIVRFTRGRWEKVESCETLDELKHILQMKTGIPWIYIELGFRGQRLVGGDDRQTLAELGITDNTTLDVVHSKRRHAPRL